MKVIDIDELEFEFLDPDKMNDSEKLYLLKERISRLSTADRYILLLYLDMGSYAKVADFLNCSATTIYLKIKKIREEVI